MRGRGTVLCVVGEIVCETVNFGVMYRGCRDLCLLVWGCRGSVP